MSINRKSPLWVPINRLQLYYQIWYKNRYENSVLLQRLSPAAACLSWIPQPILCIKGNWKRHYLSELTYQRYVWCDCLRSEWPAELHMHSKAYDKLIHVKKMMSLIDWLTWPLHCLHYPTQLSTSKDLHVGKRSQSLALKISHVWQDCSRGQWLKAEIKVVCSLYIGVNQWFRFPLAIFFQAMITW